MVDGTYQIEIDTPFGRKPGTVKLTTKGNAVTADIDAPVVGKLQTTGALDGDTFSSKGDFKLKLIGKVTYALTGTVAGDDLTITIDSSKGVFNLAGRRA